MTADFLGRCLQVCLAFMPVAARHIEWCAAKRRCSAASQNRDEARGPRHTGGRASPGKPLGCPPVPREEFALQQFKRLPHAFAAVRMYRL